MSATIKNQVFEWIIECRSLSVAEIKNVVNAMPANALSAIACALSKNQKCLSSSDDKEENDDENDTENAIKSSSSKQSNNSASNKCSDNFANVKYLLQQAGPSALTHKQTPKSTNLDYGTVEGLAAAINFKFQQISFGNYKTLGYYIEIAQALKMLMEKLRKGPNGKNVLTMKECFPRILELTKVAASIFKHYQSFLKFMDEYQRFIHSDLTFNQIRENIGRIKSWFDSQQALPMNDYTSVNYWRYTLPLPINELTDDMQDIEMESTSDYSDVESNVDEGLRMIMKANGISRDNVVSYWVAS